MFSKAKLNYLIKSILITAFFLLHFKKPDYENTQKQIADKRIDL